MHRRTRPAAARVHAIRRSACGCRCRSWRRLPSAAASRATGAALVAFHDRDHGPRDGTPARCRGSARCSRARASRADGEIVLYAFPRMLGYVFNPVSFWVCHDARRRACARCWRGQQHVRRAPPLPARACRRRAARVRRDADRAQGLPRLAVLRRARAATRSASTSAPSAGSRASTTSTATAHRSRCSRRAISGQACRRSTPAAARGLAVALPLVHARRRRAHPLAGAAALAASACRSSPSRRRRRRR